MKNFNLGNGYEVVCESRKTGNGFKHVALVNKDGVQVHRAVAHYLNRTWESYDFQTVLHKAIRGVFKDEATQDALIKAVDSGDNDDGALKSIALIAKLGDVLCDKPKEKNAWKKRFISKVQGIDFPEDFDNLPEEEKQRRLDGVIKIGLEKKTKKKGA